MRSSSSLAHAAQPSEGEWIGRHQSGPPASAQPYLALELHEVLRHAAQGKDLAILSWNDKKPHGTSVTVEK